MRTQTAKTAREARAREWILNERVLGGAKLGEVRCGTEPTVCWEGQRGAEGGAREAQAEARGPSRSHTDHGYCRRTRGIYVHDSRKGWYPQTAQTYSGYFTWSVFRIRIDLHLLVSSIRMRIHRLYPCVSRVSAAQKKHVTAYSYTLVVSYTYSSHGCGMPLAWHAESQVRWGATLNVS